MSASTEGATDGTSETSGQDDVRSQTESGQDGSGASTGSEQSGQQSDAAAGSGENGGESKQGKQQDDIANGTDEAGASGLADAIKSSTDTASEETTQEGGGEGLQQYADFEYHKDLVLSDDIKTDLSGILLGSNVSQEDAQKVMSLFEQVQEGYVGHLDKANDDQRKTWVEEAKKNPALAGKNGDEYENNLKIASRGLDRYAALGKEHAREVKELMDSGFLDNPAVFSLVLEMGKATMPDSIDPSGDPGGSGGSKKDPWEHLKYMDEGKSHPDEPDRLES